MSSPFHPRIDERLRDEVIFDDHLVVQTSATDEPIIDEPIIASTRPGFWRRLGRQRLVWIAGFVLLVVLMAAMFAPWLAPYDPNDTNFGDVFARPSSKHWLGADQFGRDTLSRLIFGARVAVIAGLEAIAVASLVGVPIGLIVGYRGGWPDRITMRIVDALMSLPGLVIALSIIAVLGPGLVNAMLAVGVLFAVRILRLVRGTVLSVREELYVDAAKLSGVPTRRILLRHILPNAAGPLLVQIALYFGAALLIEATLSFLGVGVELPNATWGNMLAEARGQESKAPFMPFPPGIALTLTVLAFNILADSIRDAISATPSNPSLKIPHSRPRVAESIASPEEQPTHDSPTLVSIRNLHVSFGQNGKRVPTLRGINLDVRRGETLGVVGESGSGKSLTALSVMGLLPNAAEIDDGAIEFDGADIIRMPPPELLSLRGDRMAMIFQDAVTALNPSMTVGRQIGEVLEIHRGASKKQGRRAAIELLDRVGVPDASNRVDDFPHQFSGGMAQRVMISMALAADPELLIADEPTSALDVTTQGQVLDLLESMRDELGLSIMFITHDMAVVADICDRVAVMYAGQVIEVGDVVTVLAHPGHPYTAALLAATPSDRHLDVPWPTIPGRVPKLDELGAGCAFADRCAVAQSVCISEAPTVVVVGESHTASCHFAGDFADLEVVR